MRRGLLAAALALAACAGETPAPRYHLGEPYLMGGVWSYPREEFALVAQGIAAIAPTRPGLTANGECRTDGLYAQHRTLQLPAILLVTNLETGRSLRLRVNDRGPEEPGRILAVSPRAAALLGATGPFQARIELDGEASRAAIAGLPGRPALLPVATAPVGRVEREALPPPEGARGGPDGAAAPSRPVAEASPVALPPAALAETVVQGAPAPGRLWLEGNRYARRDLAEREAARIGGRVWPVGPRGRGQGFQVRAGPFANLAAADAALRAALAQGIADATLVVE